MELVTVKPDLQRQSLQGFDPIPVEHDRGVSAVDRRAQPLSLPNLQTQQKLLDNTNFYGGS